MPRAPKSTGVKHGIQRGKLGGKKAKAASDLESLDAQEWQAKVKRENWVKLRRENAKAEGGLIETDVAVPALIDVARTLWLEVTNLPNILPARLEGLDQTAMRAVIVAELAQSRARIEAYMEKLGSSNGASSAA